MHKLSFRHKLMSILILIMLIGFFANLMIYFENRNDALENVISRMNGDNLQISSTLDVVLSNMDELYHLEYFDYVARNIMLKNVKAYDQKTRFKSTTYMDNAIKHVLSMDNYLVRGTIITQYGNVYSNMSSVEDKYKNYVLRESQKLGEKQDNKTIFTEVNKYAINQQNYNIITALHNLYAYNSKKPMALLCIDINYEALKKLIDKNYAEKSEGNIIIFDGTRLIYNAGKSVDVSSQLCNSDKIKFLKVGNEIIKSKKSYNKLSYRNETFFITAEKNASTNWIIIQYQSQNTIMAAITRSMIKDILLMIIIVILILCASIYFAKSISEPLERLDEVISQNYEGHLNKINYNKRLADNEIGHVLNNYNEMVTRINDYVQKSIIYEINQQQAQMKILRYQINPHFMFNTLNTISAIAELSDLKDIVCISESLSNILKYNIRGKDFVSLEEEIEQTKAYLQIQQIRFPNKFDVEYKIDTCTLQIKVIKFFLQPLIENIFKHGFSKKMNEKGLISIISYLKEEFLNIIICDNGYGMSEEKVRSLNLLLCKQCTSNTILDDESWEDNIGMKNVNIRLKNYYGNDCGIFVKSSLNKGTEILLKIKISKI